MSNATRAYTKNDIIEPSEDEHAAAASSYTFFRHFMHDSSALALIALAIVFVIISAVTIHTMFSMQSEGTLDDEALLWLFAVAIPSALVAIIFIIVSILISRHHYIHQDKRDLFSVDGYLFSTFFMQDKKRKDGNGTVRIDAVRIDECVGYHNKKDKTIWIVPNSGSNIYDIWRKGKTWDDERDLCLSLIKNGIPKGSDTDPFFGVNEQYLPFVQRIGVHIEETTQPVDFIAGTWRPNYESCNIRD